jgi:hypothetical protein
MAGGDPEHPPRRQRPHILWWAYIALLVVMFVLGFAAFFADGFFTALGPTLVSAALLSHNVVCIAGLYAYLRHPAVRADGLAHHADGADRASVLQRELLRPGDVHP